MRCKLPLAAGGQVPCSPGCSVWIGLAGQALEGLPCDSPACCRHMAMAANSPGQSVLGLQLPWPLCGRRGRLPVSERCGMARSPQREPLCQRHHHATHGIQRGAGPCCCSSRGPHRKDVEWGGPGEQRTPAAGWAPSALDLV